MKIGRIELELRWFKVAASVRSTSGPRTIVVTDLVVAVLAVRLAQVAVRRRTFLPIEPVLHMVRSRFHKRTSRNTSHVNRYRCARWYVESLAILLLMSVNKRFVLHVFLSCFVQEVSQLLELRHTPNDVTIRLIDRPPFPITDSTLNGMPVRTHARTHTRTPRRPHGSSLPYSRISYSYLLIR